MSLMSYLAFASFFLDMVLMVAALWFDRRSALNRWCALLALCFALWSLGEVFFFGAPDTGVLTFGYKLSAFGWAFVPVVFMSLTLSFTNLVRRNSAKAFLTLPFLFVGLVLLVYVVSGGSFLRAVHATPLGNAGDLDAQGLWFLVNTVSSNGAFVAGAVLLAVAHLKSRTKRYRHQSRVLISTLISVSLSNILIDIFLPPVWRYTAILWVIAVAVILFLIVRYRFLRLDYSLVEKEIVSGMDEALVLVDPDFHVVKSNPAAEKLFPPAMAPGAAFAVLFTESQLLRERWKDAVAHRSRIAVEGCAIGENSVFVSLTPVFDQFGDLIGGLALIRLRSMLDAAAMQFGVTSREKTVALMLMQGYSNKEIGDTLYISEGTVKTHVHNLYEKTGASNRVDLVRIFIQDSERVPAQPLKL